MMKQTFPAFQSEMKQRWQAWQAKTITSDLIFEMVMQQPQLCQELLRRALPELTINTLRFINPQQDVHTGLLTRGVRYDIYTQDDQGRTFILEMQVKDQHDLAQRIRYYQGMMDQQLLHDGEQYRRLAQLPTYVIFFCSFDYYGESKIRYCFEDREATQPGLTAQDGQHSIVYNATADRRQSQLPLRSFLDLMNGKVDNEDTFIQAVQAEITKVKASRERWLQNMIYEWKLQEQYDEGKTEATLKLLQTLEKCGMSVQEVVATLAETEGLSRQAAQAYYDQLMAVK